jgi:micrococcal nuclease
MKNFFACSFVVAAMLLLGFVNDVRAASLYGKVIAVNDGDLITVFNLNRPVKVRLMGVDAPETGQPFAEVAQQHLRDLVMDRMVTVAYSGLGTNSSIIGKVTLDGVDVCAQMIRDGVAWFDVNNNSRLTEMDRQIYSQSEAAARSEKRGLWQTDSVAPWMWARRQAESRMAKPSSRPSIEGNKSQAVTELTTTSLFGSASSNRGPAGSDMSWAKPGPRQWRQFQPAGAKFSVIVPSEGSQGIETMLFRDKPIDFHSYKTVDGMSVYALVWATGPFLGETNETAITFALAGLLRGIEASFEKQGGKFDCPLKPGMDVSTSGFVGREFDMTRCTLPGLARVYTRVEGDDRRLILGVTFSLQKDTNLARRFLDSFAFDK